jgi:hypothetical protein
MSEPIKCEYCNEFSAMFELQYIKSFRKEYNIKRWVKICSKCICEEIEGYHTGGGATATDIYKIKRLKERAA